MGRLGHHEKSSTPNSSLGKFTEATHWNWQDDLGIASQVSDVAVEGYPLLNSSSLADSQRHTQNGIRTKLSWNRRGECDEGISSSLISLLLSLLPAPQAAVHLGGCSEPLPLSSLSTPHVHPRNANSVPYRLIFF